jgi:hypothetical protein
MNEDEIRKYFLQRLRSIFKDDSVISRLDALTLFTKNTLDMASFYKNFSAIIDLNKINNVRYNLNIGKAVSEINIILNIQSWAKTTWEQAFVDGDINKTIISYLLIERLYLLPEKDLAWELSSKKMKKSLEKTLFSIESDVNVPENAGYSDRKYYSDYKIALENNDYKGIIDFISTLSRSWNHGHAFSEFVKVVIKICISIDYNMLVKPIEKYSPVLLKLIFDNLCEKQIIDVLILYEGANPLPLILGLIQIVNPNDNNMSNSDILHDFDLLCCASTIVEKIVSRLKVDNIFSYLSNCGNILNNSIWHSIFSILMAKNPQYTDAYINGIDWTYDEGGENSFNSFTQFCSDDIVLDKVAIKFYNKYFQYFFGGNLYHQYYFCYTTYFQYLLQAVFVISEKSYKKYLIELEKIAVDIKRCIYSWKPSNLSIYITKWIFWILGSKNFYSNKIESDDDIKTTHELLSDARFLSIINCEINNEVIDFSNLLDFFEYSKEKTNIRLPTKNGISEIAWHTKVQKTPTLI